MADISTITYEGRTYNIKDKVARTVTAGAIRVVGKTTTQLADDSITNPVMVNGTAHTALANDAVFFGKKEFIFDGLRWHEFGDMTGVGGLAAKDYASAEYTPEGDVSQPEFVGSELTSTGGFVPAGTINVMESNTGNYQPAGSVTAPSIRVQSAGATTVINSITDVGTLPTLNINVDEDSENISISFDRGTLPTKSENITVKTGDASYEAAQPIFTGTRVDFGFSGNEGSVSVTGTPAGTVTKPTFNGTEATITVS